MNARSYFGARYYRAEIGRFTTIDPVYTWKENLADPQRWNRYAYARNSPLKYIDPDGRSSVKFDAKEKKIYFYDKDGALIGSWDAANNTQSSATIGRLVDGTYDFLDKKAAHTHGQQKDARGVLMDSVDGMFGSSGIYRVKEFTGADDKVHAGVGLHSGRAGVTDLAGRSGVEFATNGCIRTTGEAMAQIVQTTKSDPLTTLTVTNNRAPIQLVPMRLLEGLFR